MAPSDDLNAAIDEAVTQAANTVDTEDSAEAVIAAIVVRLQAALALANPTAIIASVRSFTVKLADSQAKVAAAIAAVPPETP